MEHLVVTQISRHGYFAVFVIMVLESACVPISSEAVMLFAGALAGGIVVAGVHIQLNVVAVALAGAGGNLVGSWTAYTVGRVGGRPLIERFGRYLSAPMNWTGPNGSSPAAAPPPCSSAGFFPSCAPS